jgi:hypothetical protein
MITLRKIVYGLIRILQMLLGAVIGSQVGIIIGILTVPIAYMLIPVGVAAAIGFLIGAIVPLPIIEEDHQPAHAPAGIEADFNRVVEVDDILDRENARIQKIHDENNSLLANLPENEKINLLSDQEILSCKEMIAKMNGQNKINAEKQLADYEAYVAEHCILDEKSKRDADFNPLTIEADYSEEGQPAGRTWATTYHFEDFKKYIQSCNNQNKPAIAPHSRDPLNDPLHITIFRGFLTTIVSFINNVREAIQQNQLANAPELKKQEVRNARLNYYARLFPAAKANDSNIAIASQEVNLESRHLNPGNR